MDFLQSLLSWENLTVLLGIIGGVWSGFKVIVGRIIKAVDEVEDVITKGAEVMKESSNVLNAVVLAGTPEKDTGNIIITAEEWNNIKEKGLAVQNLTIEFQEESKEAWAAVKGIFKKNKS